MLYNGINGLSWNSGWPQLYNWYIFYKGNRRYNIKVRRFILCLFNIKSETALIPRQYTAIIVLLREAIIKTYEVIIIVRVLYRGYKE